MSKQTLRYIAIVISMLYGVGFMAAGSHTGAYASIGAVVCAAAWMATSMLGNDRHEDHRP